MCWMTLPSHFPSPRVSAPFSVKWRNRTGRGQGGLLRSPWALLTSECFWHRAGCILAGEGTLVAEASGSWLMPHRLPCLGGVLTEQGGEPIDIGFTVWVQECDDIPNCRRGPQHPGPYQPFPFLGSENPHAGEMGHIVFKRLLQVLWEGDRRGKMDFG